MAAPDHVSVPLADRARTGLAMPAPASWTATRPADLSGRQPSGPKLGNQGPDQGYGLLLARRFMGRLVLAPGEHEDDAVAGSLGVGLARASLFGRAPVIYDFDFAYGLWGYLGDAPPDLVTLRVSLFSGASHHYWDQRAIVDRVPETTLRLSPSAVRARLGEWRTLLAL